MNTFILTNSIDNKNCTVFFKLTEGKTLVFVTRELVDKLDKFVISENEASGRNTVYITHCQHQYYFRKGNKHT